MFAYCLCLLVFIRHYTCSYCCWNWGAATVNKQDVMVNCRAVETSSSLDSLHIHFLFIISVRIQWGSEWFVMRSIKWKTLVKWYKKNNPPSEPGLPFIICQEPGGDRGSDSGASHVHCPVSGVKIIWIIYREWKVCCDGLCSGPWYTPGLPKPTINRPRIQTNQVRNRIQYNNEIQNISWLGLTFRPAFLLQNNRGKVSR